MKEADGTRKNIMITIAACALFVLCAVLLSLFSRTSEDSANGHIRRKTIKISQEEQQYAAYQEEHPEWTKYNLLEENFDAFSAYYSSGAQMHLFDNLSDSQVLQTLGTDSTENIFSSSIVSGRKVFTLTPGEGYDTVILFIHGGGFIHNLQPAQLVFCDKLASRTGAKIYIPDYETASPTETGKYKNAYKLLENVYDNILSENKPVIVSGDSAGGGLAAGFVCYLRDTGKTLPDGTILVSPWLDISMSNPQLQEYESKDILLAPYGLIEAGRWWAGGTDTKDPMLSPLFADVSGLCPVLVFTGTDEILYQDILDYCGKLSAAGVDTVLVTGKGLYHDFALSSELPEGQKSLEIMTGFIKQCVEA